MVAWMVMGLGGWGKERVDKVRFDEVRAGEMQVGGL
jgi:hypothetical protein